MINVMDNTLSENLHYYYSYYYYYYFVLAYIETFSDSMGSDPSLYLLYSRIKPFDCVLHFEQYVKRMISTKEIGS
jgi:hypothetical protein